MENINAWMDSLKRTYELFLQQNDNFTFEDFQSVMKKVKMNDEKEIIFISESEEDDMVRKINPC